MKQDQIVIYQTKDGQTQIDVRLENENVWLNVSQMSALFDREESNVRRHVQNAFKEGELERDENNVHFLHVNMPLGQENCIMREMMEEGRGGSQGE